MAAWIAKILRQVAAAEFVELALVVRNAEPRSPEPRLARLRAPRRHRLAFNLYARIDARLFPRRTRRVGDMEISDLVRFTPTLDVVPLRSRSFEHRLSELGPLSSVRAVSGCVGGVGRLGGCPGLSGSAAWWSVT